MPRACGCWCWDLGSRTVPLAHMQVPVTPAWGYWSPSKGLACPPQSSIQRGSGATRHHLEGAESPRAEWGRQPRSEKKRRVSTQVQDLGRSTDWASVPGLRRVPSPGARPHPWLPLSSSPGFRGWSAALRWGWREAQCWDQDCREAGRGRGETEQNINAGLTPG